MPPFTEHARQQKASSRILLYCRRSDAHTSDRAHVTTLSYSQGPHGEKAVGQAHSPAPLSAVPTSPSPRPGPRAGGWQLKMTQAFIWVLGDWCSTLGKGAHGWWEFQLQTVAPGLAAFMREGMYPGSSEVGELWQAWHTRLRG